MIRQAVPLGTQHDGQLVLLPQAWVLNADGSIAEGHGHCLKAQSIQAAQPRLGPLGGVVPDAGPGDLEYGAHTHTGRPAVQGVAAGRGNQHRVHVEGGSGTEDGPHVGGIHNTLQHRHPPGTCAQLLHCGQHRPPHGAQHTPGHLIAGETLQHFPVGGVEGQVTAPGHHLFGGPVDLLALHQQRQGLIPGVQGPQDHLGALGNKDALLRLQPVAQLGLGKPGVAVQLRIGIVGDLNNVGHGVSSPAFSSPFIQKVVLSWYRVIFYYTAPARLWQRTFFRHGLSANLLLAIYKIRQSV